MIRAESAADLALTRLAREDSGQVLAMLAARFGDVDLAHEAVQDAMATAVERWPVDGIPDNPPAWLHTVARNRAIDLLRRAASARRRTLDAAPDLVPVLDDEPGPSLVADHREVGDEHLRLVLLCCHPALDQDAQVALVLRLVGGLTTAEIAAAFLVPESTLAQRIVRAKRKIRDAGIPLTIPAELDQRIDALLTVLYLVFNEGYLSRGNADRPVRIDLVQQAIRLTVSVQRLLPDNAEVAGLLALELFTSSRVAARTDDLGELVLLEQQDRSRWDRDAIHRGNAVLAGALRRMRPGPYQLQAVIAAHHANAATADRADWRAIVGLYQQLATITSSPVVALNHAVAASMVQGPSAGLTLVDRITGLDGYHLWHATRAELLLRAGSTAAAEAAFRRARALTGNPAEQRHLDRRLAELTDR